MLISKYPNSLCGLFILILSCLSYPVYALAENIDTHLKNDIQNILEKNRIKYNLPAISLSIQFPNNKAIHDYASGYNSLLKNKKITSETLFQMGSITKTFTATIIYKLFEEHQLKSDDSLTKWLPQYPSWNKITVYDLLHHTSGVYNYSSDNSFDNALRNTIPKYWSLKELADKAYQKPDLYSPGEKYHYTNTDYVLLGMIIEKITHKSIEQVFDDYFKTYGLKNTFYSASAYTQLIKSNIAHGYNRDGTFKLNQDVTKVSPSFAQSAGALISTPHDIVQWLEHLFSESIISKKSLRNMTTLISETDTKTMNLKDVAIPKQFLKSQPFKEIGIGAGIGLIYLKNNGMTWVHSGGTAGYEAFYAYNPCNGIYLALAYNVKPKQQLIFIKIADELFNRLKHSDKIIKAVKVYQKKHSLPDYCQ